MTRIAILAAFPNELKPLVHRWKREKRGGVTVWSWRHKDGEWVAACAGAGQSAVTRAFAEIEKDGPVDIVLSVGWAGGLHPVIRPALAYSVCGVIDARTGEMLPAAEAKDDIWLVTSPRVADAAEKKRLAATYKAALVDMEAATVARLARMRNIRFFCVKGVSDAIDAQMPDFNRFIDSTGQMHLGRFTLFALLRPKLWHSLILMGENSRMAAERIADSVLAILDKEGTIRNRNGYPDRQR